MSVDELNEKQLNELRESYFYQLQEQTGDEVLQGITNPEEIDMIIVKNHYQGVYFVEEDFFCSSNS